MVTKQSANNKAVSVKKKGINVQSYSASGEKKGTATLPESVFGQKINSRLLAQAVRVFLANQRKAHAKTKSRGEVAKSTRKIYKQKGTGGARHGALSAPIFVGGGIAHGPRGIENYSLNLSRVLCRKALFSALSARVQEKSLLVADLEKVEPKTKSMARVLRKIIPEGSLTIVYSGKNELKRAARNIEDVHLVRANQLSAYHVLVGKNMLITPGAIDILADRVREEK